MIIPGSCCCGAIRFELLAPPTMMATCHCTRCRKVGASTFVFVAKDSLRWLEGQDQVAVYAASPPYSYARCFCRTCGTSLGEINSQEGSFPIAANCLDTDLEIRNRFHEFVGEKPNWYAICDDVKQFEGHPVKSVG